MSESQGRFRAAVDIGGTFTDLLILDMERHRCHVGKVLTTVPDPSAGVLQGIAALLEASGSRRRPSAASFTAPPW